MSEPTVSVVVPTKDRCRQLATTLAMVLDQTHQAAEVLVVVDGSSDRTIEYLEALGHDRIRLVVNEQPLGVAAARNRGIAHATGDWVAFTDDDDLWAPRKLELQLAALGADREARWSTTSCASVDTGFVLQLVRAAPPRVTVPDIYLGNVVPGGGSGVVAERALLDEVGGFDPELSILADWDLWIRLAQAAPQAPVAEPTLLYLIHGANMSSDMAGCLDELSRMQHKYAGTVGSDLADAFGIETELWIARALARRGRRREASRLFVGAARRSRRIDLLGQAAIAVAGSDARRALDRARALLEWRRAPDRTRKLIADLQWRAGLDDQNVAPFVEPPSAAEAPR
jgi:glycosyltransferase involved in cell wall biosynthesis